MTQPVHAEPFNDLQDTLSRLEKYGIQKLRDMSWHDFLVNLLRVGSSLEHALMVQYLYAAYSLGGPQVPDGKPRRDVRKWQETLLTIAREEMGHLLTVQNVLAFLGAGVDFARGEFAWDIEYFSLEPLTRKSLACYVYAEMADQDDFPERAEIERLVRVHLGRDEDPQSALLPVGDIYAAIIALIGDSSKVPDYSFRPESYSSQASWDDWGRGYKPDPRPLDPEGNLIEQEPQAVDQSRAIVLIDPVATRTQAVAALKALAIQGEGPRYGTQDEEPSHFERLIEVFREFPNDENETWSPSLPIPTNPSAFRIGNGYISSERSRAWADLFNLRYRILLTSLVHTFRLARVTRSDEPSVRAVMMHRVFGEMYNLKAIAGILVQLPLSDSTDDPRRAGPPFEMLRDHTLPPAEADCWSLHLDTLHHGRRLCREMLNGEPQGQNQAYLKALIDLDTQTIARISRILTALGSTERYSA